MPRLPLALILVRNTVSHDARVLREAGTLRGLGYEVLVAGVVSSGEDARRARIAETEIVRLDPAAAIRRLVRGLAGDRAFGAAIRPRLRTVLGDRAAGAVVRPRPRSVLADRAAGAAAAAEGRSSGDPAMTRATGERAWQRLRRVAVTAVYYVEGCRLVWRERPVVVHANDYNTMWIGVMAKAVRGSRLIYDSHELWADRNGRPEWRPWLVVCEALFVRVADATITTSPGHSEAIAKRYRVPPPAVVRNIPISSHASPGADVQRAARHDGPCVVYVGGLMVGRGLEQAIGAVALVPGARLRLIGPGSPPYRVALTRQAERCGVADRVTIEGPVAPDRVLAAIGGADLGLMLIQPICRSYDLSLPNKLFEYAAAGLPILSSDLAVIGPLVRAEGIGAVVSPTDVASIARAIVDLADGDVNARTRVHVRAFAQRATWDRERTLLEAVYRSVTG